MPENYTIYWDDVPYYGMSAEWNTYYSGEVYWEEIEINREFLIKTLKDLLKYNDDYQREYLPLSEFMDFIEVLSNGLNGEDLYNTLCQNLDYIEKIKTTVYKKREDIRNKFFSILYPHSAHYSVGCSLRPFDENVNNLLKPHEDFKKWFSYQLNQRDGFIFAIIFDDEVNVKQTIEYYEKEIENCQRSIKYHEKEIATLNKKCKGYENTINELKSKLKKEE